MEQIYSGAPGVPSYERDTGYAGIELLIGDVPPNGGPVDLPVVENTTLPLFAVVGLGPLGGLAYAKAGAEDDVPATGLLTFSGVGTVDDTITVGGRTYTLKAAPTNVADQIKIGATAADTRNNFVAAVNGGPGSGTAYGSATVAHAEVVAQAAAGNTAQIIAKSGGAAGSAIATTESGTATSFGAATLTGGGQGTIAFGVLMVPVVTGAGQTTTARVHTSGHFNANKLRWDASFTTFAEKVAAFPPGRANILIGRNPYDPVFTG